MAKKKQPPPSTPKPAKSKPQPLDEPIDEILEEVSDDVIEEAAEESLVLEDEPVAEDDFVVDEEVAADDEASIEMLLSENAEDEGAETIDHSDDDVVEEEAEDESVVIDAEDESVVIDADDESVVEDDAVVEEADDSTASDPSASGLGGDFAFQEDEPGLDFSRDLGPAPDADEEDEEAPKKKSVDQEFAGPLKAKTSILTIVLLVMNMAAALTFIYFMAENYQRRKKITHATLVADMRYFGLPSEEEEFGPAMSRVVAPKLRLTAEQVKEAHQRRGGKGDSFLAVEEYYRPHYKPSHLNEALLEKHFEYAGSSAKDSKVGLINTVEKEVQALQGRVWDELDSAAKKYLKDKNNAELGALAEKMFFSLAPDLPRARQIQSKIKSAKEPLDIATEAVLRRMLFDILAPIELYRPGEQMVHDLEKLEKLDENINVADAAGKAKLQKERDEFLKTIRTERDILDKFGDPNVALDDLKARLLLRMAGAIAPTYNPEIHLSRAWEGATRNTFEKRQTTAFTLLSLALVRTPGAEKELVFPKLLARTQCVVGMFDFAYVCPRYVAQLKFLEQRWLQDLEMERDQFAKMHNLLVRDIVDALPELDHLRFVNKYLDASKGEYEKLVKERNDDYERLIEGIAQARKESSTLAAQLNEIQDELFRSQRLMATAKEEIQVLQGVIGRAQKAVRDLEAASAKTRPAAIQGIKTP